MLPPKTPESAFTSYLIAAVICAVRTTMTARDRRRAIHMDVPVDLRSLFGSATLRNFFGLAFITYTPGDANVPLADVAAEVQRQLTAGCEPASLKRRMMSMIKLEKNPLLRAAPLIVKDAALAIADARAAREVTTTVSSLGRVALDPCMAPYVEGISALTSTSGLNFIVCTYGDDLSIGISSRFLGQKVTRALAEVLEDEGMRGYLNANRDAPAFHRPGPLAAARKAAPVPSVFPPNSFERKSTRVRTVLAVLTLICIALIALLGGTAGGSALAVGAPCAAVALNWLFVRNMIVHAPDFIRVVERYFLVLLAVAGLWFLSTGNLIVTTYVIPGLCLFSVQRGAPHRLPRIVRHRLREVPHLRDAARPRSFGASSRGPYHLASLGHSRRHRRRGPAGHPAPGRPQATGRRSPQAVLAAVGHPPPVPTPPLPARWRRPAPPRTRPGPRSPRHAAGSPCSRSCACAG